MTASNEKKTARVFFPCVHGRAKGQLVAVNCFQAPELRNTIKVIGGIEDDIAKKVIDAARFSEKDGRAGIGVMAFFPTPYFSGESYSLALAIGDKLARYYPVQKWTAIYATGTLPADGCGKVEKINDFPTKIDLLIEHAQKGSIFIYPKDNLGEIFDSIQQNLNILQSRGIQCLPVSSINDLNEKLWQRGLIEITQKYPVLLKDLKKLSSALFQKQFVWLAVAVGIFLFLLLLASNIPTKNTITKQEKKKPALLEEVNKPVRQLSHQVKVKAQAVKQKSNNTAQNRAISNDPEDNTKHNKQDIILESTNIDSRFY